MVVNGLQAARPAAGRSGQPQRADHTAPRLPYAQGQFAHGGAERIRRSRLGDGAGAQRLAGRAKGHAPAHAGSCPATRCAPLARWASTTLSRPPGRRLAAHALPRCGRCHAPGRPARRRAAGAAHAACRAPRIAARTQNPGTRARARTRPATVAIEVRTRGPGSRRQKTWMMPAGHARRARPASPALWRAGRADFDLLEPRPPSLGRGASGVAGVHCTDAASPRGACRTGRPTPRGTGLCRPSKPPCRQSTQDSPGRRRGRPARAARGRRTSSWTWKPSRPKLKLNLTAPQAAVPLVPFERALDLDLGLTPAKRCRRSDRDDRGARTVAAVEAVRSTRSGRSGCEAVEAPGAVESVKVPEAPEAETPAG